LREEAAVMRLLLADDKPEPKLSKEAARAEMEAALANYRGAINRLPTVIEVKCYRCNHRGRVLMPNGNTTKRFKCSKCGATSL
jgi:transposase-like protein